MIDGMTEAETRVRLEDTDAVPGGSAPEARYLNRELSCLNFNARVLALAADTSLPLLERAKFLAIFASNLDEFYMVRVAGLKRRDEMGLSVRSADGRADTTARQPPRPGVPRLGAAGTGRRGHPDRDLGRPRRRRAGRVVYVL